MAQIIDIGGDYGEVEFPDEMSDADILKAIKRITAPKYDGSEYGSPADGMSGFEKLRAGFGKAFADMDRGLGQLLSSDDSEIGKRRQAEIDEAKRLDAPLMGTGAGQVGNLLGNVAIGASTAAIPGANTVIGAGAIGGAMGALMPTATGESALGNAMTGAAFGAGGQVAGRVVPNAVRALTAPFREGGRQRLAAETLNRFATNADEVMRRAGERSNVPGVNYSLAEATQDPGIAILQRGAQSLDPAISGPLTQQGVENIDAARAALQNIGGDDAAMQAAQQARKAVTAPLYAAVSKSDQLADPSRVVNLIDRMQKANPANKALMTPLNEIRESLFESYPSTQRGADAWKVLDDALQGRNFSAPGSLQVKSARTVMDRLRKGSITADEALQQLKGINPKSKTFADALEAAKAYVKTPDYVVRQNPQQLMSAVDNVKALLGKQENAFVKRELTTVKKALEHQLTKAVPEYGQATKSFASMSRPINQMEIGRALYDKATPALADSAGATLPRTRAESYAAALRDADALAQKATGFKGAKFDSLMDPQQKEAIFGVRDFLARRAAADELGRGAGSNTAQNLASQDILRQIGGPLGLPQSWTEGLLSQSIARPIGALMRPAETAVQEVLVEALRDPQRGVQLLQSLQPSQRQQLAEALYRIALPSTAVGSGAYAAGQ